MWGVSFPCRLICRLFVHCGLKQLVNNNFSGLKVLEVSTTAR